MAIVKDAVLDALFTNANAAFEKGKPTAPNDWEKIATKVVSKSTSETYHWLGKFPKVKEWINARQLEEMKANGYVIKNKTYESSVNISVDEINDDQAGLYSPMFQEMGNEAGAYPNRYVFELLKEGDGRICYDGQYFFDTDHVLEEVGTVSNITAPASPTGDEIAWYMLDTTRALKPIIFQEREKAVLKQLDYRVQEYNEYVYGIKARFSAGYGFWQMAHKCTLELNQANLKTVISAMKAIKDEKGNPLGIKPNLLVVPSSLEWKAKDLLKSTLIGDGTAIPASNPLAGAADLLVSQWLD